jgi:hypothetical protein
MIKRGKNVATGIPGRATHIRADHPVTVWSAVTR